MFSIIRGLAAVVVLVLSTALGTGQTADFCIKHPSNPHCRPPTPSPTLTASPTVTPTATPTSTPTASPTPGQSLTFPIRAAFFYPWFPEAWTQNGIYPYSHYQPSLGYYDSSNTAVIQNQVAAMQHAKIQAGIASWWGQGTMTDQRIPLLLANAGTFRWTAYYEQEGYSDPTSTQIGSDLAYFEAHYTSSPSWLRVAGKPVLFVYGDGTDTCGMADRWAAAPHRADFYLVLKVFSGYRTCANQPDSWHQYGPASAEDHQTGYSFSISPGYWKADSSTPLLTRDPTRWAQNVADMVASGEPWQLLTTWNEWGEGTAIEGATTWGTTYLDILAGSLPSPSPSPSPTAFATPTPSPFATLTPTPSPTNLPSPSPSSSSTPTPTPSSGASISHVITIWMENHEASAITSTSSPYLWSLAHTYGDASQYYAIGHNSEMNYVSFAAGQHGTVTDGTVGITFPSVWDQLPSWHAYQQDIPSGCFTGSSSTGGTDGPGVAGTYVERHNPATVFADIAAGGCAGHISNLASFDPTAAKLEFVTPNLCNDEHDCSLAQGDAFLKAFVPQILNSPDFAHTLLVITYDEGTTNLNGGGNVFTAVVAPWLHGISSSTFHNHYGLLRTVEDAFGLPCLANACSAAPLSEFLP